MSEAGTKHPVYRWVVLSTWMTAHVLGFAIISVIGILLPAISGEMGLSPSQQGLLGSSAQWGNILLAIPLALWASRLRPKLLTSATLVFGTGMVFLQGWASTFALLLMARLLLGVSLAARRAAFALLTHQWFPPREFVLANGVVNAFFGVTLGLAYFGTPLILESMGGNWRTTLYVFGFLCLAMTCAWLVLGRERPTPHNLEQADVPKKSSPLRALFRYKELWLCGLGFFGAQVAWAAFANFWPTLMLDRYGVSLEWSGNIFAINALAAAIAGMGIGVLMSRWNVRRTVIVLGGLVLGATLAGMNLTGAIPVLIAADIVNGVAWGFWPVMMTIPFQLRGIKPRETAVALAFIDTCLVLAGATGPALAGVLSEATGDLRLALIVTSFFCLALCIVGLALPFGRLRDESSRKAASQ